MQKIESGTIGAEPTIYPFATFQINIFPSLASPQENSNLLSDEKSMQAILKSCSQSLNYYFLCSKSQMIISELSPNYPIMIRK